MITLSVRSACVVLIMRSVVVIIMVQSVPDCGRCVVVRSAFSETLMKVYTHCNTRPAVV